MSGPVMIGVRKAYQVDQDTTVSPPPPQLPSQGPSDDDDDEDLAPPPIPLIHEPQVEGMFWL